MKITVPKSTIETALAPILKMAANAKLPIDFPLALTFQSDKQSLAVGCTLPEQKMSIVLADAVFDEMDTAFDVDLEMFNSADKIKPGYPPVYVMSATGDFLKNQVYVIVPELKKNKIPYVAKIYGDENNKLGHVFHVNMKLKDAALCNDEECAFFRSYIK